MAQVTARIEREPQKNLVRASSPRGLGKKAPTGANLRSVMLRTNLDFLYVFPEEHVNAAKLQKSLSLVLNHYPTMAGRIAPCGTKIDLNNAGVAFTVSLSSSDETANDLPIELPIGAPYCHIPSPAGQVQGKEPLLTVTLTIFKKGCTLGVVMSHVIADGWTFAMFMKDWSDLHNGKSIPPVEYQLPEAAMAACADRQQADEAARMLGQTRSAWVKRKMIQFFLQYLLPKLIVNDNRSADTMKRMVLHFSHEDVAAIKKAAKERCKTWISTNEAMLAYLWPILLDAAGMETSRREILGAGMAVNLRGKIEGVSDRVAGNAFVSVGLPCNLSNSKGLEQRLHDTVRSGLTKERLTHLNRLQNYIYTSTDFDWHEDARVGDILIGGLPGNISWNNQVSSPFFQIDFGAGSPTRGVLWNWKQPLTLLRGPRGGIDVYVDMSERGHATWKRRPRKWSVAKNVFLFGTLGSFAAIWKRGFSRTSGGGGTTTLTLALCSGGMMALTSYAARRSRRDATQSEQDFYRDLEKNAYRIRNDEAATS